MSNKLNSAVFIFFGGTGDLSWRKLIPSLFSLYVEKILPEEFDTLIIGRSVNLEEESLQKFEEGVRKFSRHRADTDTYWPDFTSHINFLKGDVNDGRFFVDLKEKLDSLCKDWKRAPNYIFYMATPPSLFGEIASKLGQAGFADDREHTRLVIEKPIGDDLDSAKELDTEIGKYFQENQVFRIDHYLGKETVQNMLVFRFGNPMFEPIWNRSFIDHVTITVAETDGVGSRAGYYDQVGALKDMIQNHLMQLLCLVAIEPPTSLDADEIRNKKVDVLHAVRDLNPDEIDLYAVRGQYQSYRQEPGVSSQSNTETYAAIKLFVDNWRWQGVPFYLRTGKCLSKKYSEIAIQFSKVPHKIFSFDTTSQCQTSQLIINIQPNEGIVLTLQAKKPGSELQLQTVNMHFRYQEAFATTSPDAYETLLSDIIKGDQTLFMRVDQVEASWAILMPIIEYWQKNPPSDFPNYATGSHGPVTADELIKSDGGEWPSCMAFES